MRKGAIAGLTCTLGIALSSVIYGMLASILAYPLLKYGALLRLVPILLSVILLAIILGNLPVTVAHLIIFGFGAGTPFILSSLLVTSTKDFVGRRYRSVAPFLEFGSALVLILAGLLLLLSALGIVPYFI